MRVTGGIDEAGRGPVIGSMFVGGVAATDDQLQELESLGLKDSKKLSDGKRERLGEQVIGIADAVAVKEITASEIDELRNIMSLNAIEVRAFADVIADLEPETVYIDLPEPDGDRFGNKITSQLPDGTDTPEIVAEHGADETYPLVSAASIVAKNEREKQIESLHEKYDVDFGSGYPHDQPTQEFLQDFLNANGRLPDETRTSWSTAQRLQAESGQRSIDSF